MINLIRTFWTNRLYAEPKKQDEAQVVVYSDYLDLLYRFRTMVQRLEACKEQRNRWIRRNKNRLMGEVDQVILMEDVELEGIRPDHLT